MWMTLLLSCRPEIGIRAELPPASRSGPRLEVTPADHVFEEVCSSVDVELRSVGTEPVTVQDLRYEADRDRLTLEHALELPLDLAPGASAAVTVRHAISTVGEAPASILRVDSTDPAGVHEARQRVGLADHETVERFGQVPSAVDVWLVVDTSSSMSFALTQLAESLPGFAHALSDAGLDWRLGVLTGSDPCHRAAASSVNELSRVVAALPGSRKTEVDLLALAADGLDRTRTPRCNAPIRREGAPLTVLIVENSGQLRRPERSGGLPALRDAVASCWHLAVHAIGSDDPVEPRYREVVDATHGTWVPALPNHEPPWSEKLAQVGAGAADRVLSVPLRAEPVPDSLRVRVGGEPRASGWWWDPELGAVVFEHTLPSGAEVEVRYVAASCLPGHCG